MKVFFVPLVVLSMALALPVGAAQTPAAPKQASAVSAFSPANSAALLPSAFAGWQLSAPEKVSTRASDADAAYAALLNEYGFESFYQATYEKPDRTLKIKAIRFKDASGAYGAFTFYKPPEMLTESIGDQAASANTRVLFYRGNVLIDATLDRVTATSAGELRELAADLPLPASPDRHPPVLPAYLPRKDYIPNTAKYVVGPVGLAAIGSPVGVDLVQFSSGAEVAAGQYRSDWGTATLTLISYPTPQIAVERLKAIESAMPVPPESRSPRTRVASKRSGPLVAVVTGNASSGAAKSLLGLVNYDADVTWNERVPTAKDNPGNLVVAMVVLTAVILGAAIVAGIAFGGFRILIKRLFPDRVFDRPEDVEIIRLNLR
jgi:hypothetical protein